MQSKAMMSLAGLVIGVGLSMVSTTSQAITSFFPFPTCESLCNDLYNECVAERGLKAGCGSELRNCLRFCRTGTL